MRKVVTQIMKRDISNRLPLLLCRTPLEDTKSVVNTSLRELWRTLRGENVRTLSVSASMQQIVVKRPTYLVQELAPPVLVQDAQAVAD